MDKQWYVVNTYSGHENKVKEKVALEAFKKALEDITTGMLSLGGATTKGHGIFTGELKIIGDNK